MRVVALIGIMGTFVSRERALAIIVFPVPEGP